MANTLTDVTNDMYKAAEIVGKQLVGVIPSVTVNSGSEAVALGATIDSFSTPEPVVNSSVTPAMTIPEGDDQTIAAKSFTVSQVANVQIPWTGEEQAAVGTSYNFETVYGNQILRAIKKIATTIEAYSAGVCYKSASRAYGTAGTTPFGTNFDAVAKIRQILVDNEMFDEGLVSLILNSDAGTNLRNLAQLQKANEGASDELLRRGTLLDLQGIMLKESNGIAYHTKGTATGLDNVGGAAIGDTSISLDGGDGGTLLPGDVVTFAADTANKYIVNTGFTAASGTAVLGDPGTRLAITAADEMTIGASYRANLAIYQPAVELAMRPMKEPKGGDAATDRMVIQDPVSGLTFVASLYKGFKKNMLDITTVYDAKVWEPAGVAVLLG